MPRLVVMSDEGQMTLSERISREDLQTDHFRRCLAERIEWAVADASDAAPVDGATESRLARPGRPDTADAESERADRELVPA